MSASAKLRVGIVGTGGIAKIHAGAWNATGSCEIVALCDLDTARAQEFSARHAPQAGVFASLDDFLAQDGIDLIDVCVNERAHAAVAVPSLESGRDTLCEKILAPQMEEGARMVRAARASRRLAFTQYNYRFFPGLAKIREAVREQPYGELRQIHVNCSAHCFNHLLDSMLYLAGSEPARISALSNRPIDPDVNLGVSTAIAYIPAGSLGAQIVLENDVLLSFHTTLVPKPFAAVKIPFQVTAFFETEVIELSSLRWMDRMCGVLRKLPDGENLLAGETEHNGQVLSFNPALAAVAETCRGGSPAIAPARWEDGWRVMLVSHALARSAETGQALDFADVREYWGART